jgi:hypothetical protein
MFGEPMAKKTNYKQEKRTKEIERQKKREAKGDRKIRKDSDSEQSEIISKQEE